MDDYTKDVKQWLNQRFRATTPEGYFYAHQNIYGFKSPHVEPGMVLRYVILYNILQLLGQLQFETLLDVGCAEGYMLALIRHLFGVKVQGTDLSEEACARARELFQVPAEPLDAIALPYEDESFDVVLSSETLEHIPHYEAALAELLRVARKAVLVTVPQDPPHVVAENIRQQIPHAHIHAFNLSSFRNLVPEFYTIQNRGFYSHWLRLPYRLIEGHPLSPEGQSLVKRTLMGMLNPVIRLTQRGLNERAFKFFLRLDGGLSRRFRSQRQLAFLIIKDAACLADTPRSVSIDEMLAFRVPLHRLPENPAIAIVDSQ